MLIDSPESKVQAFFRAHPASRRAFVGIITGDLPRFDGNELVDHHMNPMMEWVYDRIREEVSAGSLSAKSCLHYINELSVFARFNSQFLRRSAMSVEGFVPELAHEFYRNHLEEGGERGKLPAHYVLYSSALLKDLDIMINGFVPSPPTQMLVSLHHVLVDSHSPSTICGTYYATEGVAIDETRLLQEITNRYGQLTIRRTGDELSNLDYYYKLHLDEEHEAASHEMSVEQGHMEGIARFIRQYQTYNLVLAQVCDGFLQMLEAMAAWWTLLTLATRTSSALQD
jgi:Domain of Unknown Function with PDB structure (DUF3865)